MAAITDWHGRVVVPSLNLRGDIGRACGTLRSALGSFDRRAASRPPYEVPKFAAPFLAEGGESALAKFLEKAHPRRRGGKADARLFGDLMKVYDGLEGLGVRVRLVGNYAAACAARVPRYGESFAGRKEEVALLERMSFCPNDRAKFHAIEGFGKCAPVGGVGFLVSRAERKAEGCRNPNVVLIHCLTAVGATARRFPGVTDRASFRDREALLATLPLLAGVLEGEGRNNGACAKARDSVVAVAEATGAVEALRAYVACLARSEGESEWLARFTDRFVKASLPWLVKVTGEDLGEDPAAWTAWIDRNGASLSYSPRRSRFIIDARAAKAGRRRLEKARQSR